MTREKHNPTRAIPRKQRKVMAEEAAKAETDAKAKRAEAVKRRRPPRRGRAGLMSAG